MRIRRSCVALAAVFVVMSGILAYQINSSVKANELQRNANYTVPFESSHREPVNVRDERIIIQEIFPDAE